jgi:hypothetical protein
VAQEIDKSLANRRTALQDEDTTAFGTPPPNPELKRLEPLLGAWEAEDCTLDTFLGPGVPVRSAERFRWLDGGYFLVQHYETSFGEEPTQTGVNYWYYDSEAERFRIIFFSNNGPFSEGGNRYEGRVADGTLGFEGPARFQYDLDEDGTIRLNPDATISVSWWLQDDDGVWQPWMKNTFAKVEDDREAPKRPREESAMTDEPGPAHRRLSALVGRWRTEGQTLDAPDTPSAWIDAVDTYEWLPGGFALLHSVDARVGDQQVTGAEIIGWDSARDAYVSQYFGSDGPNAYEASLAEEDGRLVWRMRSKRDRFAGSLSEDGNTIIGGWERLDEEGKWQPWMEVRLTKAAN